MVERRPNEAEGLVGRRRELERIEASILEAVAGRGSVVFVSGEPGIGKSRLTEAAAASATAAGARVAAGRCWDAGGAPAYWPWVQIGRVLGRSGDARAAAGLERFHGGIRRADALREEDRREAFARLRDDLHALAAVTPLVLVLEDLHAADLPSLELLGSVVEGIDRAPLLVLGTYRDAEGLRDPDLGRLLTRIARHGLTLRLGGLGEEEVSDLVRARSPTAGAGLVGRALRRMTGGNPLFLEEILALTDGRGRLDEAEIRDLRVPDHVQEVIRRRLDHLPAESRALLAVASVAGPELDAEVLAAAAPPPGGLENALRPALDAGIVRPDAVSPGRYAFAHDLFREVLYRDVPAAERIELHGRIGEALEAREEERRSHADLAHHFVQAAPRLGRERALRYSESAGREAMAQLAWEPAARHFEQALALAEVAPEAPAASRGALLLQLGAATWASGAFERSKRAFRKAARLARDAGDAGMLARAALGTSGHATFLDMGAGGVDEPRTGLLSGALAALPSGDSTLRARLLARLCAALSLAPEPARRRALAGEAVAMARRLGDDETLADVLHAASWGTWGPDDLGERLAVSGEVLALAGRTGRTGLEALTRYRRLHHFLEAADREAAGVEIEASRRLLAGLPQTFYRWLAGLQEVLWATVGGDFEAAERHSREALRIGQEEENPNAFRLFGIQSVFVLRERGRLAEISPLVGEVVTALPAFAAWRSAFAWISAELAEAGTARRELDALARDGFALVGRDLYWLAALWGAAETALALEDRGRAEQLHGLLAPYGDRCLVVYSGAFGGAIARVLGALAALLDRHDAAEEHFAAARRIHERMGARAWAAHTRHDEARALLRRGRAADRRRADVLLARAREEASALGMAALEARIDALREPGAPRARGTNVFRLDGELWTIRWQGKTVSALDSKGFRYLARLLANPGRDLHVIELGGGEIPPAPGRRPSGDGEPPAAVGLGDAGEVLDGKAAASYRTRLRELEAERERADPSRAEAIDEEMEFLTRELEGARGLGGRRRRAADASDRARKAVTSRIRHALARIESSHPRLATHLDASLRLGVFCSYDPKQPVTWET